MRQDLSGDGSQKEEYTLASVELEMGCSVHDCPCCKDMHNAYQPKNLDKSRMPSATVQGVMC